MNLIRNITLAVAHLISYDRPSSNPMLLWLLHHGEAWCYLHPSISLNIRGVKDEKDCEKGRFGG